MPTQTLTIPEYAKQNKKDRTSVFKAAKENKMHLLPGVLRIKKVGRFRLLEIKP